MKNYIETSAPPRNFLFEIPEPNISRFLFADTRLAPLWLLIRLYAGYAWLMAGWDKFTNPAEVWVGVPGSPGPLQA
jgi:thiosulfate dehydrogenase (quinone) large subunit